MSDSDNPLAPKKLDFDDAKSRPGKFNRVNDLVARLKAAAVEEPSEEEKEPKKNEGKTEEEEPPKDKEESTPSQTQLDPPSQPPASQEATPETPSSQETPSRSKRTRPTPNPSDDTEQEMTPRMMFHNAWLEANKKHFMSSGSVDFCEDYFTEDLRQTDYYKLVHAPAVRPPQFADFAEAGLDPDGYQTYNFEQWRTAIKFLDMSFSHIAQINGIRKMQFAMCVFENKWYDKYYTIPDNQPATVESLHRCKEHFDDLLSALNINPQHYIRHVIRVWRICGREKITTLAGRLAFIQNHCLIDSILRTFPSDPIEVVYFWRYIRDTALLTPPYKSDMLAMINFYGEWRLRRIKESSITGQVYRPPTNRDEQVVQCVFRLPAKPAERDNKEALVAPLHVSPKFMKGFKNLMMSELEHQYENNAKQRAVFKRYFENASITVDILSHNAFNPDEVTPLRDILDEPPQVVTVTSQKRVVTRDAKSERAKQKRVDVAQVMSQKKWRNFEEDDDVDSDSGYMSMDKFIVPDDVDVEKEVPKKKKPKTPEKTTEKTTEKTPEKPTEKTPKKKTPTKQKIGRY